VINYDLAESYLVLYHTYANLSTRDDILFGMALPSELETYQRQGFLFHGTQMAGIELLEPRQAYNGRRPDGDPAIFATSFASVAVFMAIFGNRQAGSYGAYDSPRFFQVKRSNWELALEESWTGSVYVLERSGFEAHTAFGGVQTSKAPIRPVDVIGVTVEHVPIDDVEVWEPSPEQLEMWAKAKQTPMSGM
jgi:hypothetical protein